MVKNLKGLTNSNVGKQNAFLQRTVTELGPLGEELDDFIHLIAHNLKNPLGVVISYTDYLHKYGVHFPAEQLQQDFNVIWQNGHQMNNIIDELLLLVSLQVTEITLEPLDTEVILASAQNHLAYLIEEYEAKLTGSSEWPSAWGHSRWIEEVWVNYLSNAIKFGGQPPHVELGANVFDQDLVQFWVRDNGYGLTQEELSQLFVPLTELNQFRLKGDGLGLPTVRYIVERLGGRVSVESEGISGQGCVFSFLLPRAKPTKRK